MRRASIMNEGEAVVNEALHEMQRFSRGKDKAIVNEALHGMQRFSRGKDKAKAFVKELCEGTLHEMQKFSHKIRIYL